MYLLRFFLSSALLLMLACTAVFAAPDSSDKQQREFSRLYVNAMLQGNQQLFDHLLSPEIKVMPEYDKAFIGKPSAQQYYSAFFQQYKVLDYTRKSLEVTDLGERRLEIGSFDLRFQANGRDQSISVTGNYFDIWDISSSEHRLLTLAWNFDEKVDDPWNAFRVDSSAGVHYAFQPNVPTTDTITAEVMAGRAYGTKLMLTNQPALMANQYHPEAWYSPHDRPIVKGRAAIKAFQLDYAKNWVGFDYVDVNPHQMYVHDDYVLEHMSYNLRWRTPEDHSGLVMGKGVRLSKRDANGVLKSYRSISMHD